jgi:hypothetical protein
VYIILAERISLRKVEGIVQCFPTSKNIDPLLITTTTTTSGEFLHGISYLLFPLNKKLSSQI